MFNRIVTIYNRLFALWIIAGGVLAFIFPGIFLPFKHYMECFFALTMFGIGMALDPKDFEHILKHAWVVLFGVAAQFTIMPFCAFVISHVFQLPKEFSLGLILTGSAPGAMASNVLCYLAGADVAYSISLTTVSTLLSPLLTPLLTLFLAHTLFEIPFGEMFLSVVNMVVVPLLLGFAVKRKWASRVGPFIAVFPAVSTTFIVLICSLVVALNKEYLLKLNYLIFLAAIVLNIAGLVLGYGLGALARFDLLRRRALSIEIGMQNAGLGTVLALKHFNEQVALPAAIFVFICIFSASFLVQIWQKDRIPRA
ncbi:MAG: bile acid:sodium symporter family protein [Candidatus Omnitrophica bacterium]|nr:bile acid:sodium symporter family protein [Candidatus Omnitrophota bacterium]